MAAQPAARPLEFSAGHFRRRRITNGVMIGVTVVAAVIALVPLFLISAYVVLKGIGAFNVAFFTETFKPVTLGGAATEQGGVKHAIVGSILIVGTSMLLAVPIGVMAGIFLSEYPSGAASTVIRFCTDVLSAMPSIVVGVVAYVIIIERTKKFSGFAGSVALMVLMVPIITRTTEEIVKLVPGGVREAAMALGVPKWRYTFNAVIPAALGGIVTGILLAFARAMGETAPLIVTVLGNNNLTFNIFGPMAALPLIAYRYSDQPFAELNQQAWGAALILVIMVVFANILVRVVTRSRLQR